MLPVELAGRSSVELVGMSLNEVANIDFQSNASTNNPRNSLCSVGLHPWFIKDDYESQLILLESQLQHDNVVAIGECGLDSMRGPERSIQEEVFLHHIALGERTGKPLIIHCVRMQAELLRIRNASSTGSTWIVHGFSHGVPAAQQLLDKGIMISLGGFVVQNPERHNALLEMLPQDGFFMETDNQSEVTIQQIYQHVAKTRNQTVEELCKIQLENFKTVFKQ